MLLFANARTSLRAEFSVFTSSARNRSNAPSERTSYELASVSESSPLPFIFSPPFLSVNSTLSFNVDLISIPSIFFELRALDSGGFGLALMKLVGRSRELIKSIEVLT